MRKSAQVPLFVLLRRRRKALRRIHRHQRRVARCLRNHQKRLIKMADGAPLPAVEVMAPRYFALLLETSHDPLARFLQRMVHLALVDCRVVCIDFRSTEKFYSDGTLLFYAELQRVLARRPRSVKCILPKNRVACQVLSHLGLLAQLGYHKNIPSSRDDVLHWKVLSGVVADATQGVGQTIEQLPRLDRAQIGKLFRSVTEALTNVTQHAYIEPRRDGTGEATDRGWWMFVRQEPDELTVMFCDLGLGVPYTVPRMKKHEGWFARRIASAMQAIGVHAHKDGETIQVTVEEKASRFKEEHRGNGFGNMLETISVAGTGRLTIHSNRGAYNYKLEDGAATHEAYNYSSSIYGTVVGWHIALPQEAV